MDELKGGREARAQLLADLGAQHAGRRLQRRSRIGLLLLIAVDSVENTRLLQVSGDAYVSDRHKPEARIPQPLLQAPGDDLLDPLGYLPRTWITHAISLARPASFSVVTPKMESHPTCLEPTVPESAQPHRRRSTGQQTQRLRTLRLLRAVRDRIDRDYASPLDVPALARGAGMSAGHLSREFAAAYGESPYRYLMTRRIERAMTLLRRGDLSVTDVCFAVGYSSLGTFTTRFTELVGVSPGRYRRAGHPPLTGLPGIVTIRVTKPVRNEEVVTPTRE